MQFRLPRLSYQLLLMRMAGFVVSITENAALKTVLCVCFGEPRDIIRVLL